MRKIFSLIFCISGFGLPVFRSYSSEGEIEIAGPTQHSLVSEIAVTDAKESIWIAWRIQRDFGWHTYWLHPGDVGVAPSVEWILPEGVTAGSLLFPVPKRVKMGQIGAHGHHDETLFLCELTFSDSCKLDNGLIIEAKVAWLACSKTCLPGYANLSLTIPVGGQTKLDGRWKEKFDDFRKKLPIEPPSEWHLKAYQKGDKFQLVLPDLGPSFSGLYFFSEGRIVRSNAMQPVRFKNGNWELEMTRSSWSPENLTRLRGLLYRKSGWGLDPNCKFYKLDVPLQKFDQ